MNSHNVRGPIAAYDIDNAQVLLHPFYGTNVTVHGNIIVVV